MRRNEAIATLRGYLPTIRRDFGVRRLALIGSTARDEARDDGDIDLLYEMGPTMDSFVGLKLFFENRLARKVDLVTPDALKPHTRPALERDAAEVT